MAINTSSVSELEKMLETIITRIRNGVKFCADIYENGQRCMLPQGQRFTCRECSIPKEAHEFCKHWTKVLELEYRYLQVRERLTNVQAF